MDSNIVHIEDCKSLVQLEEMIRYFADSTLKFSFEANVYFKDFLNEMEHCSITLNNRLNELEQRLNAARDSYNSCVSSQRTVTNQRGESYITPDCSSAKDYSEYCLEKFQEMSLKARDAEGILSDCKNELQKYWSTGPEGGRIILEKLATHHSESASAKLLNIINILEKYLGGSIQPTNTENDLPRSEEEMHESISDKIKVVQRQDSQDKRVLDAEFSLVCASCRRPAPICTCRKSRDLNFAN